MPGLPELGLDGPIHVSVGLVLTDAVEEAVAPEQLADRWLHPGESQGHTGLLGELEDLAHLRRPLRIDEVDALAVEHDPGDVGCGQRHLADPVLEGIRGGEEQAAVETKDHDPRELLVVGCSSSSRKTCVPGSRPSRGIGGRVATEMSQSSDSPIPIITPASTPNTSVPAMAAIAIQKSKRCTLARRRISGTSIMPMTTASMIKAASTGLGSFENSGASTSRVSRTITPEVSEARPRAGAGVVVERAGGQARRDGHALEQAGAHVGHALGHRFLVDVDAIAVLGRERPGVAGGL